MWGRRVAVLLAAGLLWACGGEGVGSATDAGTTDGALPPQDGAVPDAATPDEDAAPADEDATAPVLPDAAPVTPDAALPEPDAAPPDADAAPPDTDAASPGPDAAPPAPDAIAPEPDMAAPEPDAAPPQPDAAPPEPDAADPDATPPEPDAEPPPPLPPLALNEVACHGEEWIEIVNAGDAAIDASGWILTDDPADPARDFVLPAGLLLPAGGFAVADELPFGVGCDDEHLRLLAPDRRPADDVALAGPPRGVTWGRLPDGAGAWQTTRPTPGAPNEPPGVPAVRLNEVDCHGREWIELVNTGDGTADLDGWALTDDVADPDVAHPLDGTLEPGEIDRVQQQTREEDGFRFAVACGVDAVYLLDAEGNVADFVALGPVPAAFSTGRLPDGVGEWTATDPTPEAPNAPPSAPAPELFDPFHVFLVDLTLPDASIQALGADPRTFVPATLTVNVDGVFDGPMPVGVHIKGRAGSFRTLDRKSAFKVKIDFSDADQRLRGLEKLTLNNQVQDASLVHEVLAYSVFREVGIPVPRVGYAFVRVNGQVYGLYAHVETYDDVMLDRYFVSTAHLYEGAYGQDLFAGSIAALDVDEGDPADRADLAAIVALAEAPPPEGFYAATQALIDWPEVLRVMAAEIWIGHWDGYAPTRNNYYFHFDDDGRMSLMPWGTDQTFDQHLPFHGGRGRMLELCRAARACQDAFDAALRDVVAAVDRLDLGGLLTDVADGLGEWTAQDVRREYGVDASQQSRAATLNFLVQRRAAVGNLLQCLDNPAADSDRDGYKCDLDCGEGDPGTFPGAREVCGDHVDNDCNGAPDDAVECPDCVEARRNGRRYLICPTPRPFADVAPHCAAAGSAPIVIDNVDENTWIVAQALAVRHQSYWLGLNDIQTEGRFLWANGRVPNFTNWNAGEPNNAGEEDCTQLYDNGKWNDLPCGQPLGVLCEDP